MGTVGITEGSLKMWKTREGTPEVEYFRVTQACSSFSPTALFCSPRPTQVVYQEGEKTAQALQRCSGRLLRGSRHSAKEFLNRAVLSGIDNNADKTDELKEMGLL